MHNCENGAVCQQSEVEMAETMFSGRENRDKCVLIMEW